MPSASRRTASWAASRCSPSKVRSVNSSVASSGMMLSLVPPTILPTVSTIGSIALNCRVIISCIARTISQATGTGSLAKCGCEPWPPAPMTRITASSAAAINGPERPYHVPSRSPADPTCRAYAATTGTPATSSRPSSSMIRAPPGPSSPGWNMKMTSPASSSRRAASSRAAPISPATCRSCPQACISPGSREA